VQGEGDLTEVILALYAAGRFAGLLDGRQQERDEDGDHGDNNEQFDQRETSGV
jgi:hypothetical protein